MVGGQKNPIPISQKTSKCYQMFLLFFNSSLIQQAVILTDPPREGFVWELTKGGALSMLNTARLILITGS